MVRSEHYRSLVFQFLLNRLGNPEFFAHPLMHRAVKQDESARPDLELRLENALQKLEQRLFVKNHGIQFFGRDPGIIEGMPDGIRRKGFIVFLPGEPLFLRREYYLPVYDQSRRAVVVEAGQAQYGYGFRYQN